MTMAGLRPNEGNPMNARHSTWLGLSLAVLVAVSAWADDNDVWLTTKVKTALLTTSGVSVRGATVATADGAVTLHGKVTTDAEKEEATLAVRSVGGVKSVNNLLQVVPDAFESPVKVSDEVLKEGVESTLKSDQSVEGVTVTSVNNGVVQLSGRARTLAGKARAIELAWNVGGVSRVTNKIETAEN
jgi:osmotically-inducible protein OsmY